MSVLRKNFFFAAAAGATMLSFMQSPSAQNNGIGGDAATNSSVGTVPDPAAAHSADADRKADAAMSNPSASTPSDADRRAAAAMQSHGSTPVPIQSK
jgi:hypothetical protein